MKETTYYATCTPGLEAHCARWLTRLCSVRVLSQMSGALLFAAHHAPEQRKVPFLNLMFQVYASWQPAGEPMAFLMSSILGMKHVPQGLANAPFRVMTLKENKPVGVAPAMLRAVEQRISQWTGQPVARAQPEAEYWVLYRREGVGFWMLRLWGGAERREAGRLRSELAHALAFLALPPGDIPPAGEQGAVVLDAFAGSGALVEALWQRTGQPALGPVVAVERTAKLAGNIANTLRKQRGNAALVRGDALSTQSHTGQAGPGWWVITGDARHIPLPNASVSAVCTDPPWGEHEQVEASLYEDFLQEATRLLVPGGRMVLLGPPALQPVLERSGWVLTMALPVLVSGHKAKAYVMTTAGAGYM